MGRKYQVISADGHVETPPVLDEVRAREVEGPRAAARRAARRRRGLAHRGPAAAARTARTSPAAGPISFDAASYFKPDGCAQRRRRARPQQRLREQDEDGIDAEVLFPPVFATRFLEGIKDREVYRAMIRAYNTWLAEDYCSVAPDRLIGNSVTPISDIDDAVAEVRVRARRRACKSVAFYQFPNGTGFARARGRQVLGDVPRARHGDLAALRLRRDARADARGAARAPPVSRTRRRSRSAPASHSPVYCMAQLMAAGVFDRFPDIKFYFAETNASWLPSSLFFMDDNHEIFSTAFGGRKMALTPSEYIAEALLLLDHPRSGRDRDGRPAAARQHHVGHRLPALGRVVPALAGVPRQRRSRARTTSGARSRSRTRPRYFGLDLDADITETPASV